MFPLALQEQKQLWKSLKRRVLNEKNNNMKIKPMLENPTERSVIEYFKDSRISFLVEGNAPCLPSPSSPKEASCVSFCLDRKWVHYTDHKIIIIIIVILFLLMKDQNLLLTV